MIISGKSRQNGKQLGRYLVAKGENERVTALEVRGSMSDNVPGAVYEMSLRTELTKRGRLGLYHAQIAPAYGEDGFTAEQLQKAISTVSGPFSNVALISNISNIANITGSGNTRQTQVKPDLYAPASTPGQYSEFVYLRNNNLYTLDMSINKDIRITEKVRMTLRLVALNFLNHPFFDVANSSPTSTTFGQINSGSGTRTMQFRASIDW